MFFEEDAAKSLTAFNRFSAPALKKFFGDDAQIVPIEGRDDELSKLLDRFGGIDGLIVANGAIDFYSSRVQFGKCFATFTLRGCRPSGAKTEFAKLQNALKNDSVMTKYSFHSYVAADGQSAIVGCGLTKEIKAYVDARHAELHINPTDGVQFFAVPWRELANVRVYRVDDLGDVRDVTAEFKAA